MKNNLWSWSWLYKNGTITYWWDIS